MISTKNIPVKIVLLITFIAGTLDIAAAFLNSYLGSGISPVIVLKYIASGVFGREAFENDFAAFAGLAFHYLIVFIWTLLFFIVYPKLKLSLKYQFAAGLLYGILIWLVMNLIILPLSNVPSIPLHLKEIILGIIFIMFLVGLPVSLGYHNYYKKHQ